MFNRVERARTRNKVLLQKPAFISQLLSVLFSFVKYWIIWPLWASNCWEDETKNTPLYKFCRRVSKEKGMLRWMLNRISCRATVWDHRLNGSVIHLINSLLGKKKQLSDTVLLTKDVFISFKWTVSTAFPSVCSSSPTGPTCVFMHPRVGVLCACTVNASLFFALNNGVTGTENDFVLVIDSFVT